VENTGHGVSWQREISL